MAHVYVDNGFVEGDWGRWTGGGHLMADDLVVLHDFAERIGLRRSWFQDDGRFPHYDLTKSKRAAALREGAIPIEAGEIPDNVMMKNRDGTYERRDVIMARRGK